MTTNAYGRLMLDLAGTQMSSVERHLLSNPQVGGVILFSRNIESREQVISLVTEIRNCSNNLLIAVDQEGGRVQRFQQGFTRLPAMQQLGDEYLRDAEYGLLLARDTGWLMASEVIACGLDISFAPVLDVDRNTSSIIGDRAFADHPNTVIAVADAFIKGMNEAGMAATGKHFPGHGAIFADSHLEAPVDNRSMVEIEKRDLPPFEQLSDMLGGIMPAHITFPQVDTHSVGFSDFWLQKILRDKIGFKGVIFSDDLSMKGADVAGSYTKKADMALKAGCDMILVCNCPEGAQEVLAYLQQLEMKGCEKLATIRAQQAIAWKDLSKLARYQQTIKKLQLLTDTGP